MNNGMMGHPVMAFERCSFPINHTLKLSWPCFNMRSLQVIAGLIAGGSFAEMSDFMPGVKMLLQVAQQQVARDLAYVQF